MVQWEMETKPQLLCRSRDFICHYVYSWNMWNPFFALEIVYELIDIQITGFICNVTICDFASQRILLEMKYVLSNNQPKPHIASFRAFLTPTSFTSPHTRFDVYDSMIQLTSQFHSRFVMHLDRFSY